MHRIVSGQRFPTAGRSHGDRPSPPSRHQRLHLIRICDRQLRDSAPFQDQGATPTVPASLETRSPSCLAHRRQDTRWLLLSLLIPHLKKLTVDLLHPFPPPKTQVCLACTPYTRVDGRDGTDGSEGPGTCSICHFPSLVEAVSLDEAGCTTHHTTHHTPRSTTRHPYAQDSHPRSSYEAQRCCRPCSRNGRVHRAEWCNVRIFRLGLLLWQAGRGLWGIRCCTSFLDGCMSLTQRTIGIMDVLRL
jgi:hypothetical protein